MSILTAMINYQPDKRALRENQRANVVLYAPGEKCDALPGGPTFGDLYCLVFWWPGCREEYRLFAGQERAHEAVTGLYAGNVVSRRP